MSATSAVTETPPEAVEHAEESFNVGDTIVHHILDSHEIEIPFGGAIHLPELSLFGLDISITKNVVMMWIASAFLIGVFALAARRAKEPVPRGLRNALEVLILYMRDEVARKAIGPGADRYLGYLLTVFFFILTCNLMGLVWGLSTPTGAISVTMTLALITFVLTQFAGVKENGFGGYLKSLVPHGLPPWILPIILPVEFLGLFTKPFALTIRLFANMTAGHVVVISLISLIFVMQSPWIAFGSVPFALFINLLEILVCFIQAFIFTMLSALFIGMAAHPAH